jgi:metal-responsive CopG/Arc/MetJ family transcriptional regulator
VKTAVSIPDELFKEADGQAAKEKVSRSALFARAMEQYLASQKRTARKEQMREALKHIDQTPDPAWEEARRQALLRAEWK